MEASSGPSTIENLGKRRLESSELGGSPNSQKSGKILKIIDETFVKELAFEVMELREFVIEQNKRIKELEGMLSNFRRSISLLRYRVTTRKRPHRQTVLVRQK